MCLVKPYYKAIAMQLPDSFPQSSKGLIIKIDSLTSVLFLMYKPPDHSTATLSTEVH